MIRCQPVGRKLLTAFLLLLADYNEKPHQPEAFDLFPLNMTNNSITRFGFVNFAETWNGRMAMMGFIIGLSTELLTGQGILSQLGWFIF